MFEAGALVSLVLNRVGDEDNSFFLLFATNSVLKLLIHRKARDRLDQIADKVGESIGPGNLLELRVGQADYHTARACLNEGVYFLAEDLVVGMRFFL